MPTTPHLPARARKIATRALAGLLVASLTAFSAPPSALAEPSPEPRAPQSVATELVVRALDLLGVNYKWGGSSPESGLDCSGLVRHVFAEAAGLVLPRRSEEISRAGTPIARTELRPGDLVFFNTLRRTFSHVGIYIGDGRFVHAPSAGGAVRVERMSGPYWASRFNGGRRLIATEDGGDQPGVHAAGFSALATSAAAAAASATAATSAAVSAAGSALAATLQDDRARALLPAAPRSVAARDGRPLSPHGPY
jgi:hypothetical protein